MVLRYDPGEEPQRPAIASQSRSVNVRENRLLKLTMLRTMKECLSGKNRQRVCDFLQRDRAGQWRCRLLQFGGAPMVLVSPHLRIEWATISGHDLMHHYWPVRTGQQDRLPDEIRQWLTGYRKGRSAVHAFPPRLAPLVIDRPAGRVTVRYMRNREVAALVLQEELFELPADRLASLHLTARETEVLRWVAQGKSNPEIGRILGISARTVQKHLERIYPRLGVENRYAAARMAWDAARTYRKKDMK